MQSIPQDFIEEVIARTDLVALISVVVPLKRSGKNYSACCPFHEERTPSFTVSPEKQFYYCFGCGASGNAIRFLMEHQHLGFVESLEALAQRAGLPMPQTSSADDAKQRHQRQRLTHLLEQAATFFNQQLAGPSGAQARDYLNTRGLTPKIWKQFGLGWAPNQWQHFLNTQAVEQHSTLEAAGLIIAHEKRGYYERFRGRLMFPIRDHRGKIIGFGGRVLDDTKPKYLNSPETAVFHKQQSLFGLHEWTHAKPKPTSAVLVEGYTDVIALHQAGLHQALATLGTACSTHHLNLIFQRTDTLYFCFDGDDAGHKAALRALETALPLLRDGRHIFFLQLPDGEDPDSLVQHQGPGGFIALMESAQPLSEFLLQHLTQKHRLDNVDDRAALIAEAKPFFEKVPESLYRSLLFEALAERTHINPSVLSSALLPSSAPTNHPAAQAPYAPYENNDNAYRAPTHSTPPLGPHDFSWPLNPGEPPIEHWKNQKRFANNKTGSITQQKPSWPSKQQARHKQFPPTWQNTLPPLSAERLSLIDTIMALILQNPKLGHGIQLSERILSAAIPQVELLHRLLHEINQEPDCSLAYLLGLWHNTPASHHLACLAARSIMVDDMEAIQSELKDALHSLEMLALEHHIDQALNRPSPNPSELKALLTAKSELSADIEATRTPSAT